MTPQHLRPWLNELVIAVLCGLAVVALLVVGVIAALRWWHG